MTGRVESRLAELGLELPILPTPTGSYLPYVADGAVVYLAGQTNELGGVPTAHGQVPTLVGLEEAARAAEVCALNLLAALRQACDGDLDRVDRCLRVRGFVSAVPGFAQVPRIIDGASDLFVALLGEVGRHARTAVGVATLPKNAVVEVDAVFKVRQ
ncbi:RidA family protein [Nocardia sp. NPDC024068]|uniref:RidA family protein n=1 Tax=Nocardia sp. NPDC024068 TaxID=3157197 RepID=UPI00340C7F3D